MKKRVLAVLLATTMVATAFTGCGSTKGSDESSTKSGSTDEKTETKDVALTVWSPQEDQADGNWLDKECKAFADEHPEWNITFNYGVCSEGDAKTNMATDAESAADVYMFANDQIPDLLNAGAIAELGGDTLDQIKANNTDTMINTVTYDDGVYGVPFTSNTWFMYYDKSKFTEDDVKNLDTMLEKGKVSFPLSNSWYIASFYVANGGTLFGANGTDADAGIDFGGDKGTAVTNYLVDLAANANFSDDADGSGKAGLADGSVNAIFSGSWDYDAVKEALGDNMGIAQLPTITIDGKECQMKSFAGSKAIGVNPNSKNPEVAVALAAFLGSDQAQKDHLDMRNIIPCNTGVDVADNDLAKAQSDTIANTAIVQPLAAGMSNYWGAAETMGKNILSKEVTHDNAAKMTEEMNTAMNTDAVQ